MFLVLLGAMTGIAESADCRAWARWPSPLVFMLASIWCSPWACAICWCACWRANGFARLRFWLVIRRGDAATGCRARQAGSWAAVAPAAGNARLLPGLALDRGRQSGAGQGCWPFPAVLCLVLVCHRCRLRTRGSFRGSLSFDPHVRSAERSGASALRVRSSAFTACLRPCSRSSGSAGRKRISLPGALAAFSPGIPDGIHFWPGDLAADGVRFREGRCGVLLGNYLTVVSVYSLLLLSEVCFWNSFGFDRSAAQIYFLAPVPFRR